MKKVNRKREITSLLHLDPRSKLLILVLFSVVVMIDVVDGPAYIVRIIMTFIPVFLVCLEGKIHIGAADPPIPQCVRGGQSPAPCPKKQKIRVWEKTAP